MAMERSIDDDTQNRCDFQLKRVDYVDDIPAVKNVLRISISMIVHVMIRIPATLASALLASVIVRFSCLGLFDYRSTQIVPQHQIT